MKWEMRIRDWRKNRGKSLRNEGDIQLQRLPEAKLKFRNSGPCLGSFGKEAVLKPPIRRKREEAR